MSEPMTLDAIVRILEDSTCGFVRLSPDKVAATVRAADELLIRCRNMIESLHDEKCLVESCTVPQILADIRAIRGGGSNVQ